jgi:hypothetical protein
MMPKPVMIQCYMSEEALDTRLEDLRTFLLRLGTEAHQGAAGSVIDRDYLEIPFPLKKPPPAKGKRKKRR